MTKGPLGSYIQDDIRYYTLNGKKYPSVTSIIKASLPKEALNNWKIRQVIDRAADLRKTTAKMNKANTVALLKEEDNVKRDSARDFGSNVHEYIECVIKGYDLPSLDGAEREAARRFEDFVRDFRPSFTGSEFTCYSDTYGYAGTADLGAVIHGVPFIIDIKTGNKVYPEVGLQLAAYDRSDITRLDDSNIRKSIRFGKGAVLHVRPDFYRLVEVDISDTTFHSFLALLDVFHWTTDLQHYVMKGELHPDD